MKKNFFPILGFMSLLALSACGTSSTSSSSSGSNPGTSPSTPDDSTSLIPVTPTPNSSKEEIYNFLKTAATETNYTLELSSGDATLHVTYNPKYIYYDLSDAGYIAIQSYKGNEDTLLYNFSNKKSPTIENAVSYVDNGKRIPITSTQTFNAIHDGMNDLTLDDIQSNWDYYYSKNVNLITGFAYIINATKYVGSMEAITFAMNEAKTELEFHFIPNFTSDTDIIDSLSGKLTHLGTSSVSELDNFLASYSLPSNALSDNVLSSLSGKQSFTSTVNYHYKGNVTIDQKDEVVIDENNKQITRNVSGVENASFLFYTKDTTTGHALKKYVNAENKVVKDDTGSLFDELCYQPIDLIEKDAFRETSAGEYTYFGYDGRGFISKLIDYEPGEIFSITLKVEEQKITEIHAISTTRYDSYGNEMFYDIMIEFGGTKNFKSFSSYVDPGYTPLALALDPFSSDYGFYNSFTMEVQTDTSLYGYKTKVYVAKRDNSSYTMDTIIFDQESVDTDEGSTGDPIHILTGYVQTDEGLAPFKVTENNKVIASGPVEKGKKLKDALGMDISYCLFSALDNEDGDLIRYQLHSDVDGIHGHVFGGDNVDCIVPSSLIMTVENLDVGSGYKNKVLTKIEYEFNGENLYKGKESVTFSNYGKTVVPEELDFTTFTGWVEPTTWKDGATSIYSELTTKFSEEQVALMPYVYQKEIEGNWGVDVYDDGTYIWACVFNDTYAASDVDPVSESYMAKYVEVLKANGFTEKKYPLANEGQGIQLYKDGLYVRVTDSLMGGIRFLIEK